MYKITNNKIKIGRGETPTYSRTVIFKDGSPFRMNASRRNPFVEFVVRQSVYSTNEDYVLKIYIDMSDKHKFKNTALVNNTTRDTWIGYKPLYEDRYKLHTIRVKDANGYEYNQYRYYKWWDEEPYDPSEDEWLSITGDLWVDYDFTISFQFPYYQMSRMEPRPYSYEITLIDGILLEGYEDIPLEDRPSEFPFEVVDFKKILLEPTEFFVGGSMSGK